MSSAKKKFEILKLIIFFYFEFFFLSSCTRTLSDLCMRDDSFGFEDCRFATHLLNLCVDVLFLFTGYNDCYLKFIINKSLNVDAVSDFSNLEDYTFSPIRN